MSDHLGDKELIEHRFGLADDGAATRADAHLRACAECRGRLEALQRTFSALDVLKEDLRAPRDLVERTVWQSRTARRAAVIPFRPWLAAAAAAAALVLVAAGLWLRTRDGEGGRSRSGVEETGPVDLAALRARKPFAPASAIELNVLPRRENVQITIYNSADLTLVRERRNLTLKRGWNWLQFMWANTLIDPTSLHLEPLEHKDKIDVEALVFPPRVRELGRWLIFSRVGGSVPVEITYLTSGLSWRAFYMGTLSSDEKTMRMQGYVRVANGSGEDYENAQTRLIVGKVHLLDQVAALARRQHPYGSPVGEGWRQDINGPWGGLRDGEMDTFKEKLEGSVGNRQEPGDRAKDIRKEGLSEYFLYTIEGTETIPNGWGKRLPSFEAGEIPVTSLYKYDEERWGAQPVRFVAFANDKDHKLGETPLPDGMVRIYRLVDAEERLSYVGGAAVKYIPVDEKVELELGAARQVGVEPKLMDFRTENHDFDRDKNVVGWDEVRAWLLELKNTREIPVRIEITRGFGTAYWDLEKDVPDGYAKHDATHARFTMTLDPRSRRELRYTVRTYHGTREAKR